MLHHFLSDVLSIDDPRLDEAAASYPRTNSSFSSTAAYVLNRMNAAVPLLVDGRPNPAFPFNRQRYLARIDGPAATAPIELLDPVLNAHAADVRLLDERLGSSAPVLSEPDRTPFRGTLVERYRGDAVLDQLADALRHAVEDAVLGNARQKLFASMLRLSRPHARQAALRQIRLSAFLMADQQHLVSSANWLLDADEPEAALAFVEKARRFGDHTAQLAAVETKLVDAFPS